MPRGNWPKSFRWLAFPNQPLLLFFPAAGAGWIASIDGWMGQTDRGSRQFHFPSALLVQHQHPFHSPTSLLLVCIQTCWISPISACFNQCKQRLARWSIWHLVPLWRHPPDLSLNPKKAERWVSTRSEEVLLIGVSAGSWRLHAERGQHPGKGLASFENIPGLDDIAALADKPAVERW